MRFGARLEARASAVAQARARRRLERVRQTLSECEGLSIERQGDELVVTGRGLERRMITDPRLRFMGDED